MGSCLMILGLTLCLKSQSIYGVSFFSSIPNMYNVGDPLPLYVNFLTSSSAYLPISYYAWPFCKPQEGVNYKALSLGQLFMGVRIQNSPYKISMYNDVSNIFLCQSGPLCLDDVKLLKSLIDESYRVNILLDDLPVMGYDSLGNLVSKSAGCPIGIKFLDRYYVYNHLQFKVLVHNEANLVYTVVGFDVVPCCVMHSPWSVKNLTMFDRNLSPIRCARVIDGNEIKENGSISFSYEVAFVESNLDWSSRLDAHLQIGESSVLWYSIMNSLCTTFLLSGYILFIFWRITRWNPTRNQGFDREANRPLNEISSGTLKLAPTCSLLLYIVVGNGVQILGMTFVTLLFVTFGFVPRNSHGTVLVIMLLSYLFLGIAAGYVSVRFWSKLGSKHQHGWAKVSFRVACFFPTVVLVTFTPMNLITLIKYNTWFFSIFAFAIVVFLWLAICLPLTLIGGYIGAKTTPSETSFPSLEISSHVPRQSFFAGGSVGVFALLYLITYFMYVLWFIGCVQEGIYVGYSILVALAIMLAMGAVGFLAAYSFLQYLSSLRTK